MNSEDYDRGVADERARVAARPLQRGDLIQLDPVAHEGPGGFWAGQVCVVDEIRPWGVQCYCKVPGGVAYYRAPNGTFEQVGCCVWLWEAE